MYPELVKIIDSSLLKEVKEKALQDKHSMPFPTHAIIKEDKVIGGVCLGGIPLVTVWSDTQKVKSRDSLVISKIINSILNNNGINNYFIACDSHSPYFGHMEKLGYKYPWSTNIFFK